MNIESWSELLQRGLDLERRGEFSKAISYSRTALAVVDIEHEHEVRIILSRQCIFGGSSFYEEAQTILDTAREQADLRKSRREIASVINLQALLACYQRELDVAEKLLKQNPVATQNSAPGPELAQWYHYRGLVAMHKAEYSVGERLCFRAYQVYRETNFRPGLSAVCDTLAGILLRRGKTHGARQFAQKSLELKIIDEDRYGQAVSHGTLGRIYLLQHHYDKARESFTNDLEIARELNDLDGVGIMLNSLGEISLLNEQFDDAMTSYHESLEVCSSPINQVHALIGLTRSHVARDELGEAENHLEQAKDLLHKCNPHELCFICDGWQGALEWRRGNLASGIELISQAVQSLHALGKAMTVIPLLSDLVQCHLSEQQLPEAVDKISQMLDLLAECGAERGVHDIQRLLRTVDEPSLTRLALSRHFPNHLIESVIKGGMWLSKPERQKLVVLFCDLRGFTTLSESLPPEEVVELLNEWFAEASRAIIQHGGIVDKFIGDAVMGLFGVPNQDEQAAVNAVLAAIEMRNSLAAMNLRQSVLNPRATNLQIGIGIDSGPAVVGFIGSYMRQSYTAIGDTVNTASRLEEATKRFQGCEILVSSRIRESLELNSVADISFKGDIPLKGKKNSTRVYQVDGPKEEVDLAGL